MNFLRRFLIIVVPFIASLSFNTANAQRYGVSFSLVPSNHYPNTRFSVNGNLLYEGGGAAYSNNNLSYEPTTFSISGTGYGCSGSIDDFCEDTNISCGNGISITVRKWVYEKPPILSSEIICTGSRSFNSVKVSLPTDPYAPIGENFKWQVKRSTEGVLSWRDLPIEGSEISVNLTNLEPLLGSFQSGDQVDIRFVDDACIHNVYDYARFTIRDPHVSIGNLEIIEPTCNGDADAEIHLENINSPSDNIGFSVSHLFQQGENGCSGDFTADLLNGGMVTVCEPTRVFNFSEIKSYNEWLNNGFVLDNSISGLEENMEDGTQVTKNLEIGKGIWEIQVEPLGDTYCPLLFYIEVDEPDPVEVTESSSSTDIICPEKTGDVILTATGGDGDFQYIFSTDGNNFSNDTWVNSNTKSGAPGMYWFKARDGRLRTGKKCESAPQSYEILAHESPVLDQAWVSTNYSGDESSPQHVSCKDRSDATITAAGSSGKAPYVYSYRGADNTFREFTDGANQPNLAPDITYTIRATDDNGCVSATRDVEVVNAPQFSASLQSTVDPTCYGKTDGKITLNLENQVGTVSYRLNNSPNVSPDGGTSTNPEFNVGQGPHTFNEISYIVDGSAPCIAQLTGLSNISITQPEQLGFNRTDYVSPACENSADGSLTIAGTGGSGNYRFVLNEQELTGGSVTFNDLPSGDHPLEIFEANNSSCSNRSLNAILLGRSDSLRANITTSIPLCPGDFTGSITVSATGGDFPYQFAIDLGGELTFIEHSESHTFENLQGGRTYRIFVRDENYGNEGMSSCEKILDVVLPDAMEIQANFAIDNVNCNGGSDGAIVTTPYGGAGGYSYTWTLAGEIDVISTEKDLVDVPEGRYDLQIEDANQCRKLFSDLEITEPEELLITGLNTSPETCEGRDDGDIEIETTGGTMPYYYSLNGGPFLQNNALFLDVSSGDHAITVRDQNNCEVDSAFEISLITVQIAVEETRNLFCHEDGSGRIRLSGTGGQLPHSYSIYNGTDPQASNVFEGLQAGSYEAVVLDNSGCPSEVIPLTLEEPEELLGTLSILQQEACNQSDGQAEVLVTGGTGDYTLLWRDSNLQTADPLALRGGNYTIEVRDENNCTWQQPFSINNIAPPALSYVVEDSSWCGKPLGTATVSTSGGFAPYQYLWNDEQQQETPTATGLVQNLYEVLVTDSRNCQSSIEVNVVDGQPLYLSSRITTPSACDTPEGTITISIAGGVGPYQYQWPDTVTTASVTNVENLFPGIYPVTITDSVECTLELLLEVNSTEQPTIDTVIITPSYCELPTGGLYAEASDGTGVLTSRWLRGSNVYPGWEVNELFAGEYLLEVSDENGCRAYRQAVIEDDLAVEPVLSLVSYDSSACEKPLGRIEADMQGGDLPYTYSWNSGQGTPVIEDLYAGLYTLQATDGKGCVKNLQVRIADAADPVLNLTEITRSRCDVPTGTIAVQATLGSGSYQYFWSDDPGRGVSEATGLAFGDYSVYAEDGNGCPSNTLHLEVVNESNPDLRLAELGVVSCYGGNDGFAEVRVETGNGPYTFQWNDPSSQTTSRASNLEVGSYRVVVTDANGCSANYDFQVAGPDSLYFSSIQVRDPLCYGVCSGDVIMAAVGGNFPYTFSLQNEDGTLELTGANPSGLCDGEYVIRVEDREGCVAERRVSLVQASEITLDLPEQVDICEGGNYIADAGEWIAYRWSSGASVISESRTATISQPGEYYVRITTALGCQVYDTLSIDVRDDLMMADFLVKSEIIAGDTVQLIDISWPLPDAIQWFYPEGIVVIQEYEDRITLLFPEAGEYDVSISASAGSCQDYWTNTIYVLDPSAGDASTGGRLGYHKGEIKSFILYPNPNTGSFTAAITLSEAAPITLELFEVQYGKVLKKYNGDQTDQYEVPFQESLKNGMYYLKLEALGDRKVIKFLVVR